MESLIFNVLEIQPVEFAPLPFATARKLQEEELRHYNNSAVSYLSSSPLPRLPRELFLHTLSFLPAPDLVAFSRTNRFYYSLIGLSEVLWVGLASRYSPFARNLKLSFLSRSISRRHVGVSSPLKRR